MEAFMEVAELGKLELGFRRNRVSSFRFHRHMFVSAKFRRNIMAKRIKMKFHLIRTLIIMSANNNPRKTFLFHQISISPCRSGEIFRFEGNLAAVTGNTKLSAFLKQVRPKIWFRLIHFVLSSYFGEISDLISRNHSWNTLDNFI
jgi:hypothetical protein